MAGLADVNVIDLVGQDAEGRTLVVMTEMRPWGTDPFQARQLREKVNAYVGFILGGDLVRMYPETAGRPVEIQLSCAGNPSEEIHAILEHTAKKLGELNVGFRIEVQA